MESANSEWTGKIAQEWDAIPTWVKIGSLVGGAAFFLLHKSTGNAPALVAGVTPATGTISPIGGVPIDTGTGVNSSDPTQPANGTTAPVSQPVSTAPITPVSSPANTNPVTAPQNQFGYTGQPNYQQYGGNGYGEGNPAPGTYEYLYGPQATETARNLVNQGYNLTAAAAIGAGYAQPDTLFGGATKPGTNVPIQDATYQSQSEYQTVVNNAYNDYLNQLSAQSTANNPPIHLSEGPGQPGYTPQSSTPGVTSAAQAMISQSVAPTPQSVLPIAPPIHSPAHRAIAF